MMRNVVCLLAAILFLCSCTSTVAPAPGARYALRMVASDTMGGGDGAISPSGRYVAISSRRSGSVDLWIYDIAGQAWSQITNGPGDEFEAQWSPDEKRLAFTTSEAGNKDIAVIALASREIKRITSSPDDDEYPAWSPDGRQIVYTGGPWKGRDFFIIAAEGGTPVRVTRRSGMAGACSFEPGGQSLVCHRYDSGSGNVVRIAIRSGEETRLTEGRAWDYKPTTSPDGRWVAFSRNLESPASIFIMPSHGGEARALVTTNSDDRWPTWNATGNQLLFHRSATSMVSLRVLDRESGKVRTIADESEQPGQGSFDREGRRVVYAARRDGRGILRMIDLSTGVSHDLDSGGYEAAHPRWSPDGKRIAFLARVDGRWTIAITAPEGGAVSLVSLPKTVHGMLGPIDWSPDGKRIAFKADGLPFEADLYIVDVDSGALRNVTNDHWWNESPSWTPDGESLLFMSTRGGGWTWGLFRMNVNTGAVGVVAGPDYTEKYYPRAGADGWIVWTSYDDAGNPRLTQASPSGVVTPIDAAGEGTMWPSFSSDGKLLLYTVVTHRIEYWVAENPLSDDSPVGRMARTKPPRPQPARAQARPTTSSPIVVAVRESPVQLLHR